MGFGVWGLWQPPMPARSSSHTIVSCHVVRTDGPDLLELYLVHLKPHLVKRHSASKKRGPWKRSMARSLNDERAQKMSGSLS